MQIFIPEQISAILSIAYFDLTKTINHVMKMQYRASWRFIFEKKGLNFYNSDISGTFDRAARVSLSESISMFSVICFSLNLKYF